MTVDDAIKIRADLIKKFGRHSPEVSVLGSILCGTYDRYKHEDEAAQIAKDDLNYLKR